MKNIGVGDDDVKGLVYRNNGLVLTKLMIFFFR